MDRSRHDWLQGRGHFLALVGAIDDATGIVPYPWFRQQVDDQHSIFQVNHKQRESREPTEQRQAILDFYAW